MKKRIICIALALALALCLCACGGSGTTTPATDTNDNSATDTNKGNTPEAITPAEEGNADEYPEMKLVVADYNVATSGPGQATQMACDYITEASGGKITFDVYIGGTLCESSDSFASTADGLADITYYMCGLTSGVQTVGEMFTQVFHREMPQMDGITEIIRQTYEQVPAFQEELEKQGLHCLTAFASPHSYVAFASDKAMNINTPDDMKGLIVQASSAYLIASYQDYGITGLAMGPADWYSNFERGVCDALVLNLPCYNDFGMLELIESYLWFGDREDVGGYSSGAATYLINNNTWQSMPDNVKALVQEGFEKAADWCVARDIETESAVAETEFATKQVHKITGDALEAFHGIALNTIEKWKVDVEKVGYDGAAIFEQYNAIIDEYMANHG